MLRKWITESRSYGESCGVGNPSQSLIRLFGGVDTMAGVSVSQTSALGLTAVYGCVRLIADTIASLPAITYETLPRGKRRAKEHYLYKLLHDAPNPEMTAFDWSRLMSVHKALWGAGISEIEFDSRGFPKALWPIAPWCVVPKRTLKTRELYYEVTLPEGGGVQVLRPSQVVVFPEMTTSAGCWMSPIAIHRETIGAAIAVKQFGAKTFGQGTNPAGILTLPAGKRLDEKQRTDFAKEVRDGYAGLSASHRIMLLEDGTKFERIGLPPEDAQYLESQAFGIAEICRIYNVPLHKVHEHSKSTSFGTGIEEMNIDFITSSIRPHLIQREQEYKRRLIFDEAYFVEHLIDAMLRGKLSERYSAYATARQWGWMSANDILEKENANPLPDDQGDVYLNPMNMINAELAKEYNPLANKKGGNGDV